MPASMEHLLQEILNISEYSADTSLVGEETAAPVTVTLENPAGRGWHVGIVTAGYSGTPTGGLLTVYSGGTPVFRVPITEAGPLTIAVFLRLPPGISGSVVLSSGGGGITGYLNVGGRII